ncbi:MAG: 50S ribosomal protein L23 [Bacteroidota bacterium]|nr:50S ribosomal protein L23 [Bacteroidota bacterium]
MTVLIKPIITEKATSKSELSNCYTFLVDPNSNKIQIKKAVEDLYNVSVNKVRTLKYGSSLRTRHTKNGIQRGKTNATKRAIVQVADGDSIDFFSNIK